MNYTEAIRLALAGEQVRFKNLYKKTLQKKYFLTLKYLEDKAATEDVIQEAYIRAFSKLDALEDPEKFSSWFVCIAANIAKKFL